MISVVPQPFADRQNDLGASNMFLPAVPIPAMAYSRCRSSDVTSKTIPALILRA
jgi:hypothetical protein